MNSFATSPSPHTILHRDASGTSTQYPPMDLLNSHVTKAIEICRNLLSQQRAWDAFKTIAVRYSIGRPNSWYLQGPRRMTMDQVANTFIGKILATFPLVFVDYTLKNPDSKGFHTRRAWYGQFEPRHQTISINGELTEHMTAALDDVLVSFDVNRQRLFQAHLFMIINTLVHEIGHVFITYLTEGREETTPPNINALAQDVPGDNGEAGLALECLIFGGTINYFRDPIGGNSDDQCGVAYLQTASGAYYRILQKTIDDITDSRFEFPYSHDDSSSEAGTLVSYGEGMESDTYTDPLERSEVAYLLG